MEAKKVEITDSSSPMEIIRALIGTPHEVGTEESKRFVGAFMTLFREFATDYKSEWRALTITRRCTREITGQA